MAIPLGQTWKGEEGEKRLARVKELWEKGMSASAIADVINREWLGRVNHITRNAVIGAIHRHIPAAERPDRSNRAPPKSRKRSDGTKAPPARRSRPSRKWNHRAYSELEGEQERTLKHQQSGSAGLVKRTKYGNTNIHKDAKPKVSLAELEEVIRSGPPPLLINLLEEELKSDQCHAVVEGTTIYCGHKTWNGHSYCENHSRLFYNVYRKAEAT